MADHKDVDSVLLTFWISPPIQPFTYVSSKEFCQPPRIILGMHVKEPYYLSSGWLGPPFLKQGGAETPATCKGDDMECEGQLTVWGAWAGGPVQGGARG